MSATPSYVCHGCPFDQGDYREACAHVEATSHPVEMIAR